MLIHDDCFSYEPDRRGIRTHTIMPDAAAAAGGRSRGGLGEPMPEKRGGWDDLPTPTLRISGVRRARPTNAVQRFVAWVLRALRGR
jgi:hypothetical protein